MRSALLDVKGVTRVQVLLEEGEAVVTYDARVTTVDALIEAVTAAPGPLGPTPYGASVRNPPQPAPSAE